MRKIFAGAMVFSVIGAVILGGTLAWTQTVVISGETVNVGELSFDAVFVASPAAQLGPNGESNTVGFIDVTNTGDFNLEAVFSSALAPNGSRVIVRNVDQGHASCDTDNFSGGVQDLGNPSIPAPTPDQITGNTVLDVGRVVIGVHENAPNACIGAEVTYDILIVMSTTTNSP